MLNSSGTVAIETVDSASITDEMIARYYPLLSAKRKTEIASLVTAEERCAVLAQEIAARRAVAAVNSCQEERAGISVNDEGTVTADRGMGYISIAVCGSCICCAASKKPCGLGVAKTQAFSFAEAQLNLTDTEIRAVVESSGYSLMDIVNSPSVTKQSAAELYAKLCALKNARNACVEDKKKKANNKIGFSISDGAFICNDKDFTVEYCSADRLLSLAYAVVTANK